MVCAACGSTNIQTARFCDHCAAPLPSTCLSCGRVNRPSARFCAGCSASLEASPTELPPSDGDLTTPNAERRHLTVLFCDLVGSTQLSANLDPEDWREIVNGYHNSAAETVSRFGGHVAQYLGDGLMVFFGYPQAHEEDPQRAVMAGLALLDAIAVLNLEIAERHGRKLTVRVGIHSGPVVVSDGSNRRANVFGSVPNIASHIQSTATPNTVLITGAVHHLVSGMFLVEDLGLRPIKGVDRPLQLYRVIQPSGARGRLAASAAAGLTPFVGRDDELGVLRKRWERARAGEGQAVLVIGEPGIGKSRLLQRFREEITDIPHIWVDCAAASLHQNTPFYAFEDMLRQGLRITADQKPEERLASLEAAFELAGLNPSEAVPLIAPLISLPLPDKYPPLQLEPDQRRKRLLATIVAWALGTANVQPMVIASEDLHWADPSTIEVNQLLAEECATSPVLMICTARPEFRAHWFSRAHHTHLTLNRLSAGDTHEIVDRLTRLTKLNPATAKVLVERSGGVPLFAEQLTRSVLESGSNHAALNEIPATLHDSLMARLDRLGEAREIAQIASVIGHEFTWETLREVADVSDDTLVSSLKTLADAQLLFERGILPEATYTFRHALIGDAAYQSLLRSKRQNYHRRIANLLEQRSPNRPGAQPQVLAHHYTEAADLALAIPQWQLAGQMAIQRSANSEAINHLTKGLALLETLPATPERFQQELTFQLTLGTPLLATRGFTSPEVETVYGRARELCQQAGEVPQLFPALWGLWVFYTARAEHKVARELASRCLRVAQNVGDPALLLEAHHIVGLGLIADGDFVKALEHFEAVPSIYNPDQHRSQAYTFGQDPAAVCLVHSGWPLWFLGYPDQAVQKCREGLAFAQELNHPYTSVFTSAFAAWVFCFCGDSKAVMDLSLTILSISAEHGFSFYTIWAVIMLGWAMTRQSQVSDGIAKMQEGLNQYRAAGGRVLLPAFLSLLAEVYSQTDQIAEAMSVLAEAQTLADESGECWWQVELYRLKGELILKTPSIRNLLRTGEDEAEGCFRLALEVAHRQQAKSLELRATMSLCRLLTHQFKLHEASRALEKILEWFSEGFDTADLRQAALMLGELKKRASAHPSCS
jgi:class 3 adenylate cyclase/predicted ATPase